MITKKELNIELDNLIEQRIIISSIKKDCKPFLKANPTNFLFSGRKSSKTFMKKKIRTNRRPLDTQEFVHDYIDSIFKKKFGVNLRSESMFCKDSSNVDDYGEAYYVYPIGKYNLYYSRYITDLYMNLKAYLGREMDGNPWYSEVFGDDWKRFKINHIWVWDSKRYGKYDNWPDNKLKKHLEEENIENKKFTKISREKKFEDFTKISREDIFDIIDLYKIDTKYKKTDSISDARTSGEIMLHCKEVYLVKVSDLMKKLLIKEL